MATATATKKKTTGIDPALRTRLATAKAALEAGRREYAEALEPIERRRREDDRLALARKRLEIAGGLITTHSECEQALKTAIRSLPAVKQALGTLSGLLSMFGDQERAIQATDPNRQQTKQHIAEQTAKIQAALRRVNKAVDARFANDDYDVEAECESVLGEITLPELVGV